MNKENILDKFKVNYYKLDENKNVIPCSIYELQDYFDKNSRIVKQEIIDDKLVSTVFLSIDHGHPYWSGDPENYKPVVFETMIHDEKNDKWLDYQDRYCTWQEAEAGHQRAIEWVKGGCKEDE